MDRLRIHGASENQDPAPGQTLNKESVVFERGYVPTALCRPSLLTLATGQYAHKHGVTGNDPSPKTYSRKGELYNKRARSS